MIDNRETSEFIIQALARGRNREDVIRELCERYEMGSRQAEGLLLRAETTYEREIELRRSPALLVIGGLALLDGVVMAIVFLWEVVQPLLAALAGGQTWKEAAALASATLFQDIPLFIIGIGLAIAGGAG
jgi:hypothetical protein